MRAILWSVDDEKKIDKHIDHMRQHGFVWWGVGFRIKWERFGPGTVGYLHVTKSGGNEIPGTSARCMVEDVRLSENPTRPPQDDAVPPHYAGTLYPTWFKLVKLERLDTVIDTLSIRKENGYPVRQPPQNYVAIRDPFV